MQKLSDQDLTTRIKGTKTMILIFAVLSALLGFFEIRNATAGESFDWTSVIMTMCCLATLVILLFEMKNMREELKGR